MQQPPFILTENTLTIYIDGKPYTADKTHPNWGKILEALESENWEPVKDLIDIENTIQTFISGSGKTVVKDGILYFEGEPMHSHLVSRIIQMYENNIPFSHIVKFLENLMKNPSKKSIDELYSFLEYGDLPITKDGHFLAYKRITHDWKDCHTRSVDNSIGAKPSMPRHKVDDRSENTCSTGFHFCSLEYIRHFWGERLVAVKINPADVVSIPIDYNNTKGRCCAYEVVGELDMKEVYGPDHWKTPIVDDYDAYDAENFEYDDADHGEEEYF